MSSQAKTAVSTPFESRRWTAFTALVAPAIKAHAPLLVRMALKALLVMVIYAATPKLEAPDPVMLGLSFISIIGVILPLRVVSMRFFHLATKVCPEHPLPALVRDV
jgi:hypothetical protein